MQATTLTNGRILPVIATTLAILAAACGTGTNSTGTEQVSQVVPRATQFSPVEVVESFLASERSPLHEILHMERVHQSCRSTEPAVVRCFWAGTSPVHEHLGWPHDRVTDEFTIDGSEIKGREIDKATPALDDGLVAEHLAAWVGWLAGVYPELAGAVDPDGPTLSEGSDVRALQHAYFEYMAFIGAVDISGIPGGASATF